MREQNTGPSTGQSQSQSASPSPSGTQGASPTPTASATPSGMTPAGGKLLPRRMSGQEAIDALGDRIEVVAKRNRTTVEDLERLLRDNPSAHVTPGGIIVYIDETSAPR